MAQKELRERLGTGAAVALLAAGLTSGLTGAGSAAPEAPDAPAEHVPVSLALTYQCAFGTTEPLPVGLTIDTTLPTSVLVGEPVAAGALNAELVLPEALWPALGAPASIEGTVTTNLLGVQDAKPETVSTELPVPATPVPETGALTVKSTGTAPVWQTNAAGSLTISVGPPSITLTTHPAEGTMGTEVLVEAVCEPAPEQDFLLGAVAVLLPGEPEPGAPGAPPLPGMPGAPGSDGALLPGMPSAPGMQAAEAGPGIMAAPLFPLTAQYINGESTVAKTGAKVVLGPGMMVNGGQYINPPGIRGDVALPKAKTPFYAFDFLPVTGMAEFLPANDANGKLTFTEGTFPKPDSMLFAHTEVILRISDVEINGVPYDVGPDCRTGKVSLDLWGQYLVTAGGTIGTHPDAPLESQRSFTIPPFSGCGVEEDISPIITGLVSGPGNQVTLVLKTVGK
ncbi:DUF6801 domain-containing protein [Amycolatopsis albispora]|uniref:DUF6801 domain-containing protein n=1 Tax=Amycolatopsis albispora TaxID=1804986 RepID=A0A344L8E6_9PSEU|nr:DUF6801 domain-containing protein [Amycolatopsis albispora]AXB44320.1 hypothetical protein A4R43_18815 [Amycolatopsis albispora]